MLFPMFTALFFNDGDWMDFLGTGGASVFLGVNLVLMNRKKELILTHRDGFLLTLLAWLVLSAIGAVPFYLNGVAATWIDAFFETVSGLTTTGATVFVGLDNMGHGILLWRSMIQWLGGMGIIVLAVAVLPFLGVGGLQLYRSEMPGVVKDKLQPRLRQTARSLWGVYFGITFSCILCYYFGGMTLFDAICHALTTIATGGFSTHDASFGYFDSPLLESICMVFMLIGSINFNLHFFAVHRGSLKVYKDDEEFRFYIALLFTISFIVGLTVFFAHDLPFLQSMRMAFFHTISIATTTGFATTDYSLWHTLAPMLILMIMFVGGMAGSTSGGLKVMRVMMIVRQGAREIYKLVHPHAVAYVKIGRQRVPEHIVQAVWSFCGVYVIAFNIMAVLLTMYNIDLVTAFSAVAATITSAGPGLGEVGPAGNFAGMPDGAKLILCASMLLGRLELFTILVIFTPMFWKK
ncbi:MAG: potassium transporter [Proteobacteria bacterium]|nr:potassium transporter [Pseudomonadota bacterium]